MKILLIAYLFPPFAGMTPLRLGKFVRYLANFGYADRVDVVSVQPSGHHPVYWIDKSQIASWPEQVTIHHTFPGLSWWVAGAVGKNTSILFEPKKQLGLHRHNRNALRKLLPILGAKFSRFGQSIYRLLIKPIGIPDSRVEWFPFAFSKGLQLISTFNYDVIWSFGFPFTSHLVACSLASYSSIPWVAEYGDPWTFNPDVVSLPSWRRKIDRGLEERMLRRASSVVVCTEETKIGFLQKFPILCNSSVSVVPHGYDEEKYSAATYEKSERFRVVYTGIFYDKIREPYLFFKALTYLPLEQIEILLIGDIKQDYQSFVESLDLGGIVKFLGKIPHEKVVEYQKSASVLLSFGWVGGYQIPAKLYEYFGARRPILNVQFDSADASSRLILSNSRGINVEYSLDALQHGLKRLFDWWALGELEAHFNLSSIKSMTWDEQAYQMAKVLKIAASHVS